MDFSEVRMGVSWLTDLFMRISSHADWGRFHTIWWHTQTGGRYTRNLIPLKLQSREGLGFLAPVNLSLDTGRISALSIMDGRLVKFHKWNPFVRSRNLNQGSIE